MTSASDDGCRAVERICDAWPRVQDSAEGDAFGRRNGEGGGGNAWSDPTASSALWNSSARRWLELATAHARLLLLSNPGLRGTTPSLVRHRTDLVRAVESLVDTWPEGAARKCVDRLVILANVADAKWPAVREGARENPVARCQLCSDPVAGTATDPVRRIDGDPYHASPCYNTERSRRRRAK